MTSDFFYSVLVGCCLAVIFLFFLFTRALRAHYQRLRSEKSVLLKVAVPSNNQILPNAAEQLFASLYSVYQGNSIFARIKRYFTGQETMSFEIIGVHEEIAFYLFVPEYLRSRVENSIYAEYAMALVEPADDYKLFPPGCIANFSELVKKNHPAYPLHTYRDNVSEGGVSQLKDVTVDFLSTMTNSMANLVAGESVGVQLLIRPTSTKWQKKGLKIVRKIHYKTFSFGNKVGQRLTSGEEKKEKLLEHAVSKVGFETCLRIVATSSDAARADSLQETMKAAFTSLNYEDCNRLVKKLHLNDEKMFDWFVNRKFPLFTKQGGWDFPFPHKTSIFNVAELATMFHLPNDKIKTPNLAMIRAKRAPSPQGVPFEVGKEGVILGFNDYRGVKTPIGIRRDDRRRHMYCIGKTGMGKSTLALNMIYQDIVNGEGCCFIDPHGDAIEEIMRVIPENRIKDVVLFDAGDYEYPIGLNLLEYRNAEEKDFVVNEFVAILNKLFAQFMDPMFEHIARNCLMTIAENPKGGTLVEMTRILTDEQYRNEMMKHVQNPMVKAFWKEEMGQTVEFHMSEILGPVLSKFGRFVSNDIMRNIIGQSKSGINIREVMDSQKILLVNLSKGKIGQLNTQLLGMVFVSKILMSALSRVSIPEADRKDFFLYVDEFQNFASDTFTTILSEARKYRLALYITHQYLGQLTTEKKKSVMAKQSEKEADAKKSEKEMIESVLGNVGTLMFMRVGAPDAETVEKELKPVFDKTDVINVDKYMLYLKLLVDGVSTRPFSLHCYPPPKVDYNFAERIRDFSRAAYGVPRAQVEKEIYERGMFETIGQTTKDKTADKPFGPSEFGSGK
ncbi:MAG: hypothetical protein WCP97_07190 [bacterium]